MDICTDPNFLKALYIILNIIKIVSCLIPILIIIMVSIDIFKDVLNPNASEIKKNFSTSGKRIVAALLVFLVFNILSIITNSLDTTYSENFTSCLKNANQTTINEYKIAYEEKLAAEREQNKKTDTTVKRSANSGKVTASDSKEFLSTAKQVWDKIVNGNKYFTYHNGNYIPITTSYCDCSSYVTWVLYEYGYTDFKGMQLRTSNYYNTDWNTKYGWEEIKFKAGQDITSMLKPGDIVVRVPVNSNDVASNGHMNIVASISDKDYRAYDCGNSSYVANGAYPKGVNKYYFYTGKNAKSQTNNPGKIIRPKKL